MRHFKKLRQDYREGHFSAQEGFIEWFLKRKLGFWGKLFFAFCLFLVWLMIMTHLGVIIFGFYAVIVLAIAVLVYDYWHRKN